MSLGCYPLGDRSSLSLEAQPVSVDVSYEDDLFLCIVNQGLEVAIYNLKCKQSSDQSQSKDPLIRCLKLGSNLVADQVIYCQQGDYIACVANSDDGKESIHIVFNWRETEKEPEFRELDFRAALSLPTRGPLGDIRGPRTTKSVSRGNNEDWAEEFLGDHMTESELISVDCCQKTGNLAISCCDIVQIYKFTGGTIDDEINGKSVIPFEHIISVKLSISALSISFVENYLSIRASDHVQVLKLELLTLQIQSDGFDCCDTPCAMGGQCSASGSGNASNPTTNGDRLANNTNNNHNHNNNTTTTTTTATTNSHGSNHNSSCNIDYNTMMNANCVQSGSHHGISFNERAEITWNLNTTKLVKLPTLMHNSSTNLDSYHICHPSELLGPASETIACRVNSSIFSPDLNQNQLELVVMLCKQFDSDNERLLSAQLEPIYLTNTMIAEQMELRLLKSNRYESLASVNCFVNTNNYCHVYSLHGKKAFKLQTIIHPDQCLNIRPDMLNAYLLNPLGLQICSLGSCDQAFHYDWSSSGDLNLSFVGTDRRLVVATRNFIILVSNSHQSSGCLVEFMKKPDLVNLHSCILYTVSHCDNNSIRTNLLTYLHATCHLALAIEANGEVANKQTSTSTSKVTDILKQVSIQLSKQLLHKKQTNVLTNNLIDKTIKHLLDISQCDLPELVKRTKLINQEQVDSRKRSNSKKLIKKFADLDLNLSDLEIQNESKTNGNNKHPSTQLAQETNDSFAAAIADNDIQAIETLNDFDALDHELIKIYIKHAKYSQTLLDYLVSEAHDYEKSAWLISLLFEHNPSLLIKCAQRYPLTLSGLGQNNLATKAKTTINTIVAETSNAMSPGADLGSQIGSEQHSNSMEKQATGQTSATTGVAAATATAPAMHLLVDKLKLLAELDSTGINRATVLFTLAILYNALGERAKCLAALDHIKPLNHLAITMRSNWEVSHSIAGVVRQRYPDFVSTMGTSIASSGNNMANKSITTTTNNNNNSSILSASSKCSRQNTDNEEVDDEDDATLTSCSSSSSQIHKLNNEPELMQSANDDDDDDDHELASGDSYERKLKLVAELSTSQLLDLLSEQDGPIEREKRKIMLANLNNDVDIDEFMPGTCNNNVNLQDHELDLELEEEAERNLLEASINLLESQFILERLRENCG